MLGLLKWFERFLTQVLMIMMAIVLLLTTVDLGWTIIKAITLPFSLILSVDELLELFGLFVLVIIGIELLLTNRLTRTDEGAPLRFAPLFAGDSPRHAKPAIL